MHRRAVVESESRLLTQWKLQRNWWISSAGSSAQPVTEQSLMSSGNCIYGSSSKTICRFGRKGKSGNNNIRVLTGTNRYLKNFTTYLGLQMASFDIFLSLARFTHTPLDLGDLFPYRQEISFDFLKQFSNRH